MTEIITPGRALSCERRAVEFVIVFLNHNAFRCPGAPSLEDLRKKQKKVSYLVDLYSQMRRTIIPHAYFIDESTVEQLREMSFVFICIDKGTGKRLIVERLQEWGVAFVDVGMGIQLGDDNKLGGIVRVTTSTTHKRDHIPFVWRSPTMKQSMSTPRMFRFRS